MIDKINFSVSVLIFVFNAIIVSINIKVYSINYSESDFSPDFISNIQLNFKILLFYSLFMLIYCLIYILIYPEVNKRNLDKDAIIIFLYILLILSSIYQNWNACTLIYNEMNNEKIILNFRLDKINNLLHFNQGFLVLLIPLLILRGLITAYREGKKSILNYFLAGGTIGTFEFSKLIS